MNFGLIELEKYKTVENKLVLDSPNGQIGATLYKIPPGVPIDISFWKKESLLGKAIAQGVMMTNPLLEKQKPHASFNPVWMGTEIISMLLGYDSFGDPKDVSVISSFSDSTFKLGVNLPKNLLDSIGNAKMNGFQAANIESIHDYVKGSGKQYMFENKKDVNRFIISLHPYNDVNYVYMTMRIDQWGNEIEHRHIQQSLKTYIHSYVAQRLGKTVNDVPHRLSMLMHSSAIRLLEAEGILYKKLYIEPLIPMLRILKKTGFVSQNIPEQNGIRVELEGLKIDRLRNYFYIAQKTVVFPKFQIGKCIGCGENPEYICGYCEQPILCNVCKHLHIHECI